MDISDIFEKVSANIGVEFSKGIQSLSEAIQASGTIAKEAGYDIEEYAATVGKLEEVTRLGGSTIGAGLKMIFSRMGRATDGEIDAETVSKVEKAYQSIGVALRDTNGEFRDIPDVLADLSEKWGTLIAFNVHTLPSKVRASDRKTSSWRL